MDVKNKKSVFCVPPDDGPVWTETYVGENL
jgi:hypothetical protein